MIKPALGAPRAASRGCARCSTLNRLADVALRYPAAARFWPLRRSWTTSRARRATYLVSRQKDWLDTMANLARARRSP